MNLLSLPEEVLLTILSFLNARDILVFAAVSRYAKGFYDTSCRLQYIVELEAAGCVDPSLNSCRAQNGVLDNSEDAATISEKLNYLRTRERRWRELDLLKNARKLPLDQPMEVSIYDLSSGVFAFGEVNREGHLHYVDLRGVSRRGRKGKEATPPLDANDNTTLNGADTNGNATGQNTMYGPMSLSSTDVPWQRFPFEGNVADIGFALKEYDLIVLITYNAKDKNTGALNLPALQETKLNLYEFSTHRPHPLAKEAVLKLAEKPSTYRRPSPVIEVAGKYIILLLTFPRAVVEGIVEDSFVINWQTGRIIHHQTYDTSTYCSLAFVTPSLFVMPNLKDNSLDLVHIFSGPDNIERACWVKKLRLPELTNDFELHSSVCRGDPNPTEDTPDLLCPNRESQSKARARSSGADEKRCQWGASGYGITADPLRAIISFKFVIVHGDAGVPIGPAVNLIVHRSTLASLALDQLEESMQAELHRGPKPGPSRMIIPETSWDNWGPPVTRWRLEDDYVEWVTTTAGQRQVLTAISSDVPWRPIIVIRDYNPYEVRRAKTKAKLAEESGKDDVEIYVDSVRGEKENDSEDEDELGLGDDTWVVGHADQIGEVNGPGDNQDEIGAEVQADEQVHVTPQAQETADEENAGGGEGPNASEIVNPIWDEGLAAVGESQHQFQAFMQQVADWPFAFVDDPQDQHGVPLPAIPPFTSNSLPATITLPDSGESPSASSSGASSPSQTTHTYISIPAGSPSLKRTSIRVRDTEPTLAARYYKTGQLRGGLPFVEYTVEGNEYLYSGLLMDEERIIGYMESDDNPDQVEKMLHMSVFSMYP